MRGPPVGPKGASRGSEKSHLLGASPCSSTPQGGPLYGWKKRGIFAVVGSGQRGLGVCLHVRQVPAHRAQVFEPRGGRRLLIAGCKCPAGSRKGMGTPGRHRAPGPERVPWKIPRPGPRYPSLSLAHCLCGAESAAGQCGLGEMARCSEWQGGPLFPRTGAQGPSETAVTSQGRVT